MLGRTHIVVGLFMAFLLIIFFNIQNFVAFSLFVVFGSLLPDIDKNSSIIGRKMKSVSLLFSHRGFFHSLYALALFSLVIYLLFDALYSFAFVVGYLWHLVFDSFTRQGIAYFLFDKKIKGEFLSGGLFDSFLFWLFLFSDIYLTIVILL